MALKPEKLNKRKSRVVGRLAAESRNFSRGNLNVSGRFLAENGWEYPFAITDISPGGILAQSDYIPKLGEQLVMITAELGRIQGKVIRCENNGFACIIQSTSRKRDQLADRLTWLLNYKRLGLKDDRIAERTAKNQEVYVTLDDGTRFIAASLDMSITGMLIQTKETVRLAEKISVGKLSGTVSRITETGFAIQFDIPIATRPAA
ncbi:MAG: hypothetical protein JKY46_03475 [Robiginitomaculum sp.]|nr:hypothetical protein [Robiginitomaculum sp.]